MNNNTEFSDKELLHIHNVEFFQVKKSVFEKVNLIFAEIAKEIDHQIPNLKEFSPKITKGENYNDLPYIVLDYPSLFSKEKIFAFRIIFIWGYGFSFHLLYKNKESDMENVAAIIKSKSPEKSFFCQANHFWTHHFDEKIYFKTDEIELKSNHDYEKGLKISFFSKSMNLKDIKKQVILFNNLIISLKFVFFDNK